MDTNSNQTDKKDLNKTPSLLRQKLSHEAVFMNMSKKTEKISTALYMVTDLISVDDPIRHRIRECGVELIAQTRSMSHSFSGDIYFVIARTINKSWEIISLVEVASSVGFISDMNARILKSVLVELISSLRDKQKRESFTRIEDLKIGESLADQISLSKSLFEVKEEPEYKRQNSLDTVSLIKDKEMSFINPKEIQKRSPEIKEKQSGEPAIYSHKEFPSFINKPKSGERRPKIIEIIKEKGEVNVNDILTSFPGISSKTIQRELNALVEENVLKRVGEKRWSKYFLL